MSRASRGLRLRGTSGVTLMEIVVALGILSVVLISLGALMYQVSSHTRRSAAASYLSAAVQSAQAWVEAVPWDSLNSTTALAAIVGCRTDTTGQLVYSRCTTVTDVGSTLKRIQVVLQPTGNLVAPPDTVLVYRAKPLPLSPFRP